MRGYKLKTLLLSSVSLQAMTAGAAFERAENGSAIEYKPHSRYIEP